MRLALLQWGLGGICQTYAPCYRWSQSPSLSNRVGLVSFLVLAGVIVLWVGAWGLSRISLGLLYLRPILWRFPLWELMPRETSVTARCFSICW